MYSSKTSATGARNLNCKVKKYLQSLLYVKFETDKKSLEMTSRSSYIAVHISCHHQMFSISLTLLLNLNFFKIPIRRPSKYFSLSVIPRPVAGTIPGTLCCVPGYITFHVCAGWAYRMQQVMFIFV